ncbi:hypothetical protein [Bacillus pumilus]|uniref:hypothetical protein n=1 Tax=Bacillus pumilus TaxID=1408 RepID=UPI0011A5B5D5|nr:hypothetical protein [Bacillus pumilus]
MNVMVFEGFLGAGKTAGASVFAKAFQERSGCALYSNYGLKDSKPFTQLEDFFDIAQESSSLLVLDEAHMDLDSRSFSSNHVKFFTQTSYYLRKLRCTMIITSPSFDDLDSRIRGITNILCKVRKENGYFIYDLFDIQSNRFLRTYRFKQKHLSDYGSRIFDTTKMVTPVVVPEKREDFKIFLDRLKAVSESYTDSKKRQTAVPFGA